MTTSSSRPELLSSSLHVPEDPSSAALTAACWEYLTTLLCPPNPVIDTTGLLPTPVVVVPPQTSVSTVSSGPITAAASSSGVMMCLASVLENLSGCDERCVFSVRKINKLGFKSHAALKKYFAQFGQVLAIFFLPYRYKPDTSSVRPSSMAFVQMADPASVQQIFASGQVHYVQGWPVTVQRFTRGGVCKSSDDI